MKCYVVVFFCFFSFSVFSSTLEVKNTLDKVIELEKSTELTIPKTTTEKNISFQCYYTIKWLYEEFAFIDKLEALA